MNSTSMAMFYLKGRGQGNRNITTEYRKYNGIVYEGRVIYGHTNVMAMEVASAPGQTASGNGISFPRKQWRRLPRSERFLT